jgi:hypothetical protein
VITVDDRLAALFQHGPLRGWYIDDIRKDKLMRFAQAYVMMAKARHRPAAPGGLSAAQLRDDRRLHQEAVEYAIKFQEEEDSDKFWIGCSHYPTNRASLSSGAKCNPRRH